MAQVEIVNNIRLNAGLKDKDGDLGTSGQILSSTGDAVNWIDVPASDITGSGATNYLTYWDSATSIDDTNVFYTISGGLTINAISGTFRGYGITYTNEDTYKLTHGGANGGLLVYNLTDTRNEMAFDGTGNVGVGTIAPDFKLDVAGDIGIDDYVYHNGDPNTYIGFPAVDTFTVTTNSTEKMRVKSSGAIQLNSYGSGTITGTAQKMLAVDSSGNIIEENLPTGDITGVTAGTNLNGGGTSGNVTLNLDSSINLNELSYAYPTATGQYHGEIVTFGSFINSGGGSNGTIAAGDVIVYTTAGLAAGWVRAQGTISYGKAMLGIAMGTTPSAGILIKGFARNAAFASGGLGAVLYLSPTSAGDTTNIVPSATNNIVRIVGYMLNPTNDEIFFDPDKSWVQVS